MLSFIFKEFGSSVVFVQKGKINLALRNVAQHLCRTCIFYRWAKNSSNTNQRFLFCFCSCCAGAASQ